MSFKIVNQTNSQAEQLLTTLLPLVGREKLQFHLALGATALSDLDGLSAAGIDAQSRRMTPALDSEALLRPFSPEIKLPASPAGVTSPIVLTRAALEFLEGEISVADCGTYLSPQKIAHESFGDGPASLPSSGQALKLDNVRTLFEQGREKGRQLRAKGNLIALAECVPGGTSTAACLLELLGIEALAKVSSSLVKEDRKTKSKLLTDELENLSKKQGRELEEIKAECQRTPLLAVALAGDPMQAYGAGFLLGAALYKDEEKEDLIALIAAGGSQMLAVWKLADLLLPGALDDKCLIVSTSYVAEDSRAQVAELARSCRANFLSFDPGLELSRHAGLRAYTEGHVKEGVGAGASCFLASLKGQMTREELVRLIDKTYEQMVLATC